MSTHSDLTEVEGVELSSNSDELKSKSNTDVSLMQHLRQVTTPDHNLSDYCLCVVTVHVLRNYQQTHSSEPIRSVVYTCTPKE